SIHCAHNGSVISDRDPGAGREHRDATQMLVCNTGRGPPSEAAPGVGSNDSPKNAADCNANVSVHEGDTVKIIVCGNQVLSRPARTSIGCSQNDCIKVRAARSHGKTRVRICEGDTIKLLEVVRNWTAPIHPAVSRTQD